MDDLFAKFIKDEYEWVFGETDCAKVLLDGFDGRISEDEFYENFDTFMNQATNEYCNNEWIIQQMHDNMHDILVDVIKDYLNYLNDK